MFFSYVSAKGENAKDGEHLKIREMELKDVCKPSVCNDSKYVRLIGGDCLFIYSLEILSE